MGRRPAKGKAGASSLPQAASRWCFALPAAIAWLLLFGTYFFTCRLQNNGGLDRLTLALLLPDVSAVFSSGEEVPSDLRYLPQRFDLVATAALIAGGIGGLGGLVLRVVGGGAFRRVGRPYGAGAGGTPASQLKDRLKAVTPSSESDFGFIDAVERLVVKFGLGASAWSLLTLGLGLAGWLSRPLFLGLLAAALLGEGALTIAQRRRARMRIITQRASPTRGFALLCLGVMAPFVVAAALAAMLPPFEFDVKEYHLGGPKEWFLDGRVHFLPHNVYTSFPFLTEMLSLSAMVVRGDWYRGALAGQFLLSGFLPLTAAAVFVTGRRLFGTVAGLLAAVVYVTTPWAYRIAAIAYAEGGLACFLALALFATVVAIERMQAGEAAGRAVLLTGLFAGSAMACKYPGAVQVVVPIGIGLVAGVWRGPHLFFRDTASVARESSGSEVLQPAPLTPGPSPQGPSPQGPSPRGEGKMGRRLLQVGMIYSLGVLLTVGPWLMKNAVETGNPVYPLLWSLFGGRDWDAELNAKWKAGHSSPHYDPKAFFTDAVGVAAASDGQSLLVFALAPLALLGPRRRAAVALWLFVGFLYVSWWVLTHRIERFWVPMLPAACVLAGAGAVWAEDLPKRLGDIDVGVTLRGVWRACCGAAFMAAVLFNFGFDTSTLAGNPSYLVDLEAAAKEVETPGLAALNRSLPPGSKVLLVGEAQSFDARYPVSYNTVFDRSLFEEWTAELREGTPKESRPLRPAEEIRRTFAERGVTHVMVNWREVLRYRTTYGFTRYVTPERFAELRAAGVLGEPTVLSVAPVEGLPPEIAAEAERAFPSLFRGSGEGRGMVAGEVYPVVGASLVE